VQDQDLTARFDGQSDEATLVACAMQSLSAEHREVLTLKYIIGMSSAEIGKMLGKRSDAIDSLLQRAREAFARTWETLSSDVVTL
jgi:RNA polymerase sigma factor (sigma-70 family)